MDYLREAVSSREETFDQTHPELAQVRFLLARALVDTGEMKEAEGLAERALSAYVALGSAFAHEQAAVRSITSLVP